ncbi:MAG: aminomethyl-transferring glycine dehydrogenase subunit GcvPB [Alphaproteobacteria bacterium]|nr:aminomethyl-transferring glycine dehydrogenase subunit GcvPB [Alphaproteobacteria bacterium]
MSGGMNRTGRPSSPASTSGREKEIQTFSGHKGLEHAEPLLFERGSVEQTGVDLPKLEPHESRLGGLDRHAAIGLPGLSEPEAVRHFVRLSRKNYAIDTGLFPLGSCTMKHNPRLNEKVAGLPGFADIHPLQPEEMVQGALEVMHTLSHWLCTLTGMPGVALSPKAGAHGELCGLMTIRAALEARGDARSRVLVPDSAHGTNPATAALCGYSVDSIPGDDRGRMDLEAFREKVGDDVAAVMLTNPNTCGLFENDIIEIAEIIHDAGGFFYCDGANFNAIVGKVRPGDLGIDCMHINLHKTFSTPHGGGGPGAGPVVFSDALVPYMPAPFVEEKDGQFRLVEQGNPDALGRMTAFQGQMGMYVRALTYMLSHGSDGLRQVAEDAVLNANYIMARLSDVMTPSFEGPCMHEALFDDRFLKDTGVSTLDFAKARIDEGFHPMTMYFPLVVHGAMLIEPTETESRDSLDLFITAMRGLAEAAQRGETERFENAPVYAPLRRLDETQAARNPVLTYQPPAPQEAAE